MKCQLIVLCIASVLVLQAALTSANAYGVSDEVAMKKESDINKSISSIKDDNCRGIVEAAKEEQTDIFAACKSVEESRELLITAGCTKEEYENLHGHICFFNGKYIFDYK